MIRGQRTEGRGQSVVCRCAAPAVRLRGKAATKPLSPVLCPLSSDACPLIPERGFTLVEMIMVIVITGIIGGMVAVFLRAPVQQYMDVSRRADMTDIADTALRRISRDLRTALPNSVRVTNPGGGTVFLEYLETIAGGRYNSATVPVDCLNAGGCTDLTTTGDLVTGVSGVASTALVNGGTLNGTSRLVVYNQYNNSPVNNCSPTNPSVYCAAGSGGAPVINSVTNGANAQDRINFAVGHTFRPPGGSPNNRFQIVSQPVTYACTQNGRLMRYWGYGIQPAQPTALGTLQTANLGVVLANNVGATCTFTYDAAVTQRSGLVTMQLTITDSGETVSLYSATHVSNLP